MRRDMDIRVEERRRNILLCSASVEVGGGSCAEYAIFSRILSAPTAKSWVALKADMSSVRPFAPRCEDAAARRSEKDG